MAKQKKIALITGAGGGIGTHTVNRLAGKSFHVYATDLSLDLMSHLTGANITTLALDVTDEAMIRNVVSSVMDKEGRIDLLINNAGYAQLGAVECVSPEQMAAQFNVNLFGYGRMQNVICPIMRKQGAGRIINISSVVGKISMPGFGWYAATKHAVEAMSDALREELAPFGVHVTMVEPGLVATPFIDKQRATLGGIDHPPGYEAMIGMVNDVGKDGSGNKPEDIAAVIVKVARSSGPIRRRAAGSDAKFLFALRRWLGDGVFFAFVRSSINKYRK